jgi:hypothetical protein
MDGNNDINVKKYIYQCLINQSYVFHVFAFRFDFTPEEVMSFCNDCVLATDHDADQDHQECEIPEHFYDIDDYFKTLKP